MIGILLALTIGAAPGEPGSSIAWKGSGWYAVAQVVGGPGTYYEMAPARFAEEPACVADLEADGLIGGEMESEGYTIRCVLMESRPADDPKNGGIVKPKGANFSAAR